MNRNAKILIAIFILVVAMSFLCDSFHDRLTELLGQLLFSGVKTTNPRLVQFCGRTYHDSALTYRGYYGNPVVISCTSRVLDYTIKTSKTDYYNGRWGCFEKVDIYKGNNLIYSSGWFKTPVSNKDFYLDDLMGGLGYRSYFAFYECWWVANAFFIKVPENSFNVSVGDVSKEYREGDVLKFEITVTNEWYPVNATVKVKACTETGFGEACKWIIKKDKLYMGTKTYEFEINLTKVTDKVKITPYIDLEATGGDLKISGLNLCPTERSCKIVKDDTLIKIGTYEGDTYEIKIISPEEITVTKLEEEKSRLEEEKAKLIEEVENLRIALVALSVIVIGLVGFLIYQKTFK